MVQTKRNTRGLWCISLRERAWQWSRVTLFQRERLWPPRYVKAIYLIILCTYIDSSLRLTSHVWKREGERRIVKKNVHAVHESICTLITNAFETSRLSQVHLLRKGYFSHNSFIFLEIFPWKSWQVIYSLLLYWTNWIRKLQEISPL